MSKKITLLHSNDMHGDFLAEHIDEKLVGGVSLLSGYLNEVRTTEKNVLYAIAGDMFRGSVIDSEFKGISTIELMNYLQPDVVTVGNHETDYGVAHLLFLEKCALFPIVNANLYIKANHHRLFRSYEVITIDGLNIMFIGVVTEEVLAQTKGEEIIGSFVDIWDACEEVGVIIDNYKNSSIDLTVLLTHIGIEADKKLAAALDPEWGVDLIIGGHSHTRLQEPVVVNGIPIVQAYTGTDQIGRFDLQFDDNDRYCGYSWQCIPIDEEHCKPDPVMEELLNSYKEVTDRKYQRLITTFRHKMTHPARHQETELGNLFADLLQVDSSFDIMFLASGSIRKTELGPIVRYQDMKEIFPYDGPVVMLEITGEQLRRIFMHLFREECMNRTSEFYQVSKGVHVVYDCETKKIEELTLHGKEVTDEMHVKIGIQKGFHFNSFEEFFGLSLEEARSIHKEKLVITSIFGIYEELMSMHSGWESPLQDRIVLKNRP